MRFAPAERNALCAECVDISRQLNDAYAVESRESDSSTPARPIGRERTQAAAEALRRLFGGTEEDAERADELLDRYDFRQHYTPKVPPAALAAFSRCVQHAIRSGHWLRRIAG